MSLRLKRLLTGNMKTRAKKSHLKARYLPAPKSSGPCFTLSWESGNQGRQRSVGER